MASLRRAQEGLVLKRDGPIGAAIAAGTLATIGVSLLLTYTLPDTTAADRTESPVDTNVSPRSTSEALDPPSAAPEPIVCPDLTGTTAATLVELDSTGSGEPLVSVTDSVVAPAGSAAGTSDLFISRTLQQECLGWEWTDAALKVADGTLALRRSSGRFEVTRSRLAAWRLEINGRTLSLQHVNLTGQELPEIPWSLTVELDGATWLGRPASGAVPVALDERSGSWELGSAADPWEAEIHLPRLAALRVVIDTRLADRTDLLGPISLGIGAPATLGYALILRRRRGAGPQIRRIVQSSISLTVLYVIVLAVQWSAVNGVQTSPLEDWWVVLLPLVLPPGALLAADQLRGGGEMVPVVIAFVIVALGCVTAYIAADRFSGEWPARTQAAVAFTLVIAAIAVTGLVLATALASLPRPRRRASPLNALTTVTRVAGIVALSFAIVSEWVDTYDFVSPSSFSRATSGPAPLELAGTKLLAYHPISTYVWPQLLTLMAIPVLIRCATSHDVRESPAVPVPAKRWWPVILIFTFAVVGVGGRYLGVQLSVGAFVSLAVAASFARRRRWPRLTRLMDHNQIDLSALIRHRSELLYRAVDVERLRRARRAILRRGKEDGFSAADLVNDLCDVDARIKLVSLKGIGVPQPGLHLVSADAAGRLVLNGGTGSTWLANVELAMRRGALLALVPMSYFLYVFARDVPFKSSGVDTLAYVIVLIAEVAFWLGAAFTVGALSAWLPGSNHLTKGLALAMFYAGVTALAASLAAWLGDNPWGAWRFNVAQMTAFLGALGLLLDNATVRKAGLTWREQIDLYGVGHVDSLIKYATPLAIAILSIAQQVVSGDANSIVSGVLESATALAP